MVGTTHIGTTDNNLVHGYDQSPVGNTEISETILYNNENKIVQILYGYPENPIEWPHLQHIELKEHYFDITEPLFKLINDNKLEIPAGYYADHTRTDMIGSNFCLDWPSHRCIYKEIIIIRADGSKIHYSKWDKVTIIF